MTRRVIDSVVLSSISGIKEEEDIKKYLYSTIGQGTTVDESDFNRTIKFERSMFKLRKYSFITTVKELSKNLLVDESKCFISTENGSKISISSKGLSYMKALVLYSFTCDKLLGESIFNVLTEIRLKIDQSLYNDIIDINEEGVIQRNEIKNKNLYEFCKKEIYQMFKEAGVIFE